MINHHLRLLCHESPHADALPLLQWISEVLHFCQGLPIILVGCTKDLRYDQKTIEELRKTSQKPVSPEEVSLPKGALEALPDLPSCRCFAMSVG